MTAQPKQLESKAAAMNLFIDEIETPIGVIILAAFNDKLHALEFKDTVRLNLQSFGDEFSLVRQEDPFGFSSALKGYFNGDTNSLETIPVSLGGTEFQQRVWLALRDIPWGTTISYGELAARVGSPKAYRAVGLTNGRNPISLVLPCHRVIGSDGSLTGYGGGLKRKEWLLRHERVGSSQLSLL